MNTSHGRGSECGNGHGHPVTAGAAFAISVLLNSLMVLVEAAYGWITNSTALWADAGHNLSDVLGLLMAWGADRLARQPPSGHYTYGLRSSSILAALANAMLLLLGCGAIAWEAVHRFAEPPSVPGWTVALTAGGALVVNAVSAALFMKQSHADLNIHSAYLHLVADAAVSMGVVAAGAMMVWTGWNWLDPAMSLVIVGVILLSTWGLLRKSFRLAMQAVPAHIDAAAVEAYLRQCPGVADVHDLHIWGMSTTESALTAHIVTPAGFPGDSFLECIQTELSARFAIHHSTLQIETDDTSHRCVLDPRL